MSFFNQHMHELDLEAPHDKKTLGAQDLRNTKSDVELSGSKKCSTLAEEVEEQGGVHSKRKHVSFAEQSGRASMRTNELRPKDEGTSPLADNARIDGVDCGVRKPLAIKSKDYGGRFPGFMSNIISKVTKRAKKLPFSPDEKQKRTLLLSEDAQQHDFGSNEYIDASDFPTRNPMQSNTTSFGAEKSSKLSTLQRNDWTIQPADTYSASELSQENLLKFDHKNSAKVLAKRDHSIACALINILGGLILGYSDIGVNTALSVLYPCALEMVPEHNFMWWVAGLLSVVNIGAAAGALLGGFVAERYGRKSSMILGGIFSLAPLMTMFVYGFWLHFLSRIITGVGVGFTSSVCGTYVSEMAPAKRRGFLNSFFEVSINSGILIANIVAYFALGGQRDLDVDAYCHALGCHSSAQSMASYRLIWIVMIGAVGLAALFLILVTSPLVPESTIWLKKHAHMGRNSCTAMSGIHSETFLDAVPHGECAKAFDEQSLTKISVGWASTYRSADDLNDYQDAGAQKLLPDTDANADFIKPYASGRVYKRQSTLRRILQARKPLAIAVFDAIALQLTGMYALMFYCHKFLEQGHINQKFLGTLGIMAWNWASTFISLSLVERAGRRKLLIPSMCVLSIAIFSMPLAIVLGKGAAHGVFFLFFLLFLYIAAYEVGPGVLFWVICAEVFPHDIAQMGFAFVNCLQWILMVVVTFLFPPLQKLFGGWVFGIFFIPSLISTVFFYFCLPETKGRSRKDVSLELSGGNWLVQNRKLW